MTMMIATLRPPEVILKQDCPIAWPIDDAIILTDPAQEQLEWIRSRYHQTLFLPEQLAPLEQLARDLQRMSLPPQASTSTSTSTLQIQHDPSQPEPSSDLNSNPISQLLLTLPEIEKKHRKRLSEPIERYIRNAIAIPGPTATTATESGVDVTAGVGMDTKEIFENDLERRNWREGMRYRAESGGFSIPEGVQEDREVGRMRKRVTDEFERREVMIQIILLLTHMQLQTSFKSKSSSNDPEPPNTDKDDSRKTKKKRLKKPPKSSSSSTPSSPVSDPAAALDLLTDRLTVWQAIGGTEVAVYSEKDVRGWINGKKILAGEGDGEEDWVKRFWRVVVWPLFGSRRRNMNGSGAGDGGRSADVEKFVRGMHRKVFGADVVMEEDVAPKTIAMELEPVVAAPKRTMKREPSVIAINPPGFGTSNSGQSTFIRSASVQAVQMGTGSSRRSSMESNSSVRMLSTSIKDPSRAGSMGPPAPAPGRRVSGNGNAPDSLDLDESELDSLGRSGSLRRSTSRVNSGMNLFKGREVGFSRSNSFKPIESSGSNSQAGTSLGQNGSGSGSGTLGGGVPLGRTSSAMAGMNVILGKRKTMIVPKDKTSSGSFIKPTDPAHRTAGPGGSGGLQKSFSTSMLAMATPSKPRYESRLTAESQPIPMAAAPALSAFVAETPSNASARRQTADSRFTANKASWESTRQVLFPTASGSQGEGGSSLKGEDQHGLADFMEDTDDEDDGASFFTSGKRRRLDSNAKDNLRHVVLFRNPAGDAKQDQYTQLLTATKRFRPKSLSVLGQTFVNQQELAEVIRSESDKWSGLIATSKRAGEAWCAACKIVKQEGHGGDPDWSHVPLYTPGPATGASFVGPDLTSPFIPRRIDAAEETGSAIPLGTFIVHHHRTLSQNPERPLLILEGDKNGPNLTETLGDTILYSQRETYATGPREDLALDLLHLCQTLSADSSWNRPTWLVFFAPSSAKAVLDCLELTEFASGLPLAGAPRVESMLRFRLASVGNTTAAYLSDRGLEVEAVAKQPTAEGVRDALQEAD
ncbi:hypothetical protein FFLO_00899 [Filobasidium floriforme]|uniref:Uroporphyrinogen-III cosynthase n=1 Tax=Filobasidium floriforme TaxID=5210 RepID=A0A8K0NT81_9TREE|nr:uncharacterized protein HD553DRAFT_211133 [Filobasidium floriforme]KAG7571226.1 hypothetical protein FFLO_00899 [Filobasidium floriforme]KAH8087067.1 hypothetical protein HD553DRAFT_211133 [Filobasidium floriforme]